MIEVLRRNPITRMNFVDQGNRVEAVKVVEGEGKPLNLMHLVEKMCQSLQGKKNCLSYHDFSSNWCHDHGLTKILATHSHVILFIR